MMNTRTIVWIVGGLTVLAAGLRLIGLNSELWYDEIKTLIGFVRNPLPEIVTQYSKSNHLLYSVLAHTSVSLLGEHPWSLRLPAVVFGVACIPTLYMLGARVTSQLEALLAAGLLAVSYHHIWFSQDARGYTVLVFWTLLSTVLLLRGLRDNKVGWYIAYGWAAALGLYTHLTMAFVVVAHMLASLNSLLMEQVDGAPVRWRLPAIGFTLAAAISLLLYAPVLMQVHHVFTQTPPDLQTKTATVHWAIGETLHSFKTGLGMWGALLGFLLLTAGFWSYLQQSRLVVSLLILPGFLTILGIILLQSPMRPRFFFLLIGFGLLMVVRGGMLIGCWAAYRWNVITGRHLDSAIIGTALVAMIMLANVASLSFLYQHPKQNYSGALRFVEATQATGDTVITAGLAVVPYRDYYGRTWQGVERKDELHTVRSRLGRVWMLYSFPEYIEPTLANSIRDACPPVRVFSGTLGSGDVVVCALHPKHTTGNKGEVSS